MKVTTLVGVLIVSLTILTGVCTLQSEEIRVQAGEMVALLCPFVTEHNPDEDSKIIWTSYTSKEKYMTYDTSSAEKRQMLICRRTLVILTASVNHQGNYSCSLRNSSSQFWFSLTVNAAQSTANEGRVKYSMTCYAEEPCFLSCPDINTPDVNTLNLIDIVWHKEGDSLPRQSFILSVGEEDSGLYTCTRLYQYHSQIYNMTFAVSLDVKQNGKSGRPQILSPNNNDVFYIDLGSTVVIDCKAVLYSIFDEIFWMADTSFVETNDSFPVFYNSTWEDDNVDIKMKASLIIRSVSKVDLSRYYICKLESVSEPPSFVNITLAQRAHPFPVSLTIVCILFPILAFVVVFAFIKFEISISLFLRDSLCCHSCTSDGKRYDAFLMYYRSHTDAGLNEDSRKCLESVLEETFGYRLCLYNRDVPPGKAEAEAVLASTEQCQTIVLVPTSDFGLASDVLNDIHGVLLEGQIHLISIKTATTVPTSGSLPEAIKLLDASGNRITWKGTSSMTSSSSFFKQLRYYLPAPRPASNLGVLPHSEIQNNCC